MITTWQMYWLTRLDSIGRVFFVISLLLLITILVLSLAGAALRCADKEHSWDTNVSISESHKNGKTMHRYVVRLVVPLFVLSAGVTALIPSTRQMAAILIVPKIANSEKVCAVGNRLYDLAVEWLDDLKPNKKRDAK